MSRQSTNTRINIRPEVSILSVLRHLNYKPWFALAEFVDNSIQSFLTNRQALQAIDGDAAQLRVDIVLESDAPGRIVVRDNAAGILERDYARAFKPAEIPPDRSGLSEFGMGMKSAACWLALNWSVRTSALGEPLGANGLIRLVDIIQIRTEELVIATRPAAARHYTEVILFGLHIHRREGPLERLRSTLQAFIAYFSGQFTCPHFNDALTSIRNPACFERTVLPHSRPASTWRKEIAFDFGRGLQAGASPRYGNASVAIGGFCLFSAARLIQGSADETTDRRPYSDRRTATISAPVRGAAPLKGLRVSHTKDGFRWEENEEVFLDAVREHLDAEPLPLLAQAEGHRVRPSQRSLQAGLASPRIEPLASSSEMSRRYWNGKLLPARTRRRRPKSFLLPNRLPLSEPSMSAAGSALAHYP